MLNPVTVTPGLKLIAGGRRLKAAERCGWATVPAIRVTTLEDALLALKAEYDENICREPLAPTEQMALAERIEAIEKPAAAERQRATQAKPGEGKTGGGNLPPPASKGKVREKIAGAIGMGARTYEKAKAVTKAAEADPAKYGDLPAKMDTVSVDAAHKELKARSRPAPVFDTDAIAKAIDLSIRNWRDRLAAAETPAEAADELERIGRALIDQAEKMRSAA